MRCNSTARVEISSFLLHWYPSVCEDLSPASRSAGCNHPHVHLVCLLRSGLLVRPIPMCSGVVGMGSLVIQGMFYFRRELQESLRERRSGRIRTAFLYPILAGCITHLLACLAIHVGPVLALPLERVAKLSTRTPSSSKAAFLCPTVRRGYEVAYVGSRALLSH